MKIFTSVCPRRDRLMVARALWGVLLEQQGVGYSPDWRADALG